MSTASRGANRERQVKRQLESEGWAVTRGAGSHGEADLWAAKERVDIVSAFSAVEGENVKTGTELRLIQVKTDKRNPYDHFGPKEREALIALADQTGGTCELFWWPANKPLRVIPESEWPRAKVTT
jgi:Holliday junction resolvase